MIKNVILKFTLSIFIIFILLLSNHIFYLRIQGALKGGCAKVNITPPVGSWLSGFAARNKPSEGVLDELYVKTLVLDDGKNVIAVISCDLIGVTLEITNQIRAILKEEIGIPEKNVLVLATHTHYGPEIRKGERTIKLLDEAYVQNLIKTIIGSVHIAYKNLKEVKIGAVKGDLPEVALNRRFKKPDGSVAMSWGTESKVVIPPKIERKTEGSVKKTYVIPFEDPELTFGEIDPEVCVLRVEDLKGDIIGSIVNFACHTSSGGSMPDLFYYISADYSGYTAQIVEQMEGGICLFALGTAGNIVSIKRGKEIRTHVGKALGAEALRRLQFVPTSSDITIKTMSKSVNFPRNPDRIKDNGKKYITTEIQILKIGDIYLLGLPAEVLVEIGLDIKRRAGIEKLFIISLSNDAIGYVCPSEAYEEGGYEPGSRPGKGAGEIMTREALDIIKKIQQNK